jgi:superfamily II DNA or RNA helicase
MLYKRAFRKEKEVATFLIKDKMTKLAFNLRIEPRPYQSEATDSALARGQAVCSLPTGTGKTLKALVQTGRGRKED